MIRNEDLFGPVTNDTLVIVIQVHNRLQYLRHLIVSLSQVRILDVCYDRAVVPNLFRLLLNTVLFNLFQVTEPLKQYILRILRNIDTQNSTSLRSLRELRKELVDMIEKHCLNKKKKTYVTHSKIVKGIFLTFLFAT